MAEPTTRLPDAGWTMRTDLAELVAALGAGNVRWVGGAVRDTLLGWDVHDIDAATPLVPHEVVTRLEKASIRSVPTGIAHGTVTALLDGGPVEITTLRHDVTTDGRRATVAFAEDWRDDAARRDFTINALYARPGTLEIDDFFGGLADLAAKRVRFIGDARARIREDHLRILRYYRFQARFGSDLDPEAEEACAEMAPMLKGLSKERIGWEVKNLLMVSDPTRTILRMAERGVLKEILPQADPIELAMLVVHERRQGVAPNPIRRLAALIPSDALLAEKIASRLRWTTSERKRLVTLAKRPFPRRFQDDTLIFCDPGYPQPALPTAPDRPTLPEIDPRELAYRTSYDEAVDQLLLAGLPIEALRDWNIPRFPLKGGEIVARGISAGPQVARVLKRVEQRWIAEGFPNRARVEALLEEELPQ